jgi:hypothetical protein
MKTLFYITMFLMLHALVSGTALYAQSPTTATVEILVTVRLVPTPTPTPTLTPTLTPTPTPTPLPKYTLTVNAPHGSVAKSPDLAEYDEGTTVSLTATADTGYHFTVWSGDVPVGHATDNPLVETMDGNKQLKANFAIGTCWIFY